MDDGQLNLCCSLLWVADLFKFEENDNHEWYVCSVGFFMHLIKKVISFSSSQYISGNDLGEY